MMMGALGRAKLGCVFLTFLLPLWVICKAF